MSEIGEPPALGGGAVTIPRICTFVSLESPPSERFMAVFYVAGHKGKLERLPIAFYGPDADSLRERAAQWWRDEQAKEQARQARAAAMVASKTKKAADVGAPA